eukprot:TRINITY_DN32142_c0_g1_i1.p1 TRINITY_DN32142_c0_g1~~TRINITY_DN32142_c0_g1_i1.p1  ORF type:complete len:351 (-),score=61.21 TRINITY_DN32142_c0_g1_i1:68-1120(-)
MIQPNCSAMDLSQVIGPSQVFSSIGYWSTTVYIILALHVVPVWVIGTMLLHRIKKVCLPDEVSPLSILISIPQVLMFLTSVAILIPSLGKYVEVLLELVLCVGLVKFLQLSLTLCGGQDSLISCCSQRGILLPVGSPPLVCLLPCTKPAITKYNLSCVMLGPYVLLGAKAFILVVDLIYLSIDYIPSGDFLAVDNIHNLLSFPVGLGAIYCLNIFLVIINDCLAGNKKRFLGLVLLLEFILFDCQRLFFIFLTGSGMLTCVPPFLSQDMVVHLLKNIIKAFLATFIGIPYLSICAEKTELITSNNHVEDTKDVAEIHFHGHQEAIVKDEHEQHSQDVFEDECGLDLQRSI